MSNGKYDGVPAPAPAPAPAPPPPTPTPPAPVVNHSTNGRCASYGNNNQRCPGKQCCSSYRWCGTGSAYCAPFRGGIGRDNGLYDGEG
jgi:hypothetical protein